MSFSSLIKQLKKRLKLRKRWISLGIVLLLAGSAVLLAKLADSGGNPRLGEAVKAWSRFGASQGPEASAQEQLMQTIVSSGESRQVETMNRYVCGEETTRIGMLPPDEIAQYKEDHPAAVLSIEESGLVRFTEDIDDLSPACKESAYFGLDKAGNLSLFNDLPEKDQVLRTFFQLNIERMRSSLPPDMMGELYHGIQVHDLAEYNSVLSTFSPYSLDDPAMVPLPAVQ